MKTKLLKFIALFIFGVSAAAYAQNDIRTQETKQAVERISRTFRDNENFAVHFTISVDGELDDTKGVITVSGKKYNVAMPENHIIYDGEDLYNYDKANKEVIIEKGEKGGKETSSLASIFSLDVDSYRIEPVISTEDAVSETLAAELIPIASGDINKVEISVQRSKEVPEAITIYPQNGNPIRIVITKVLLNIPVNNEMFIFDSQKYKNVEIIDFR